jgi:hypothetical protein
MASNTTLCAKQINTNKSNLNGLQLGVETLTAAGAISTTIPITVLTGGEIISMTLEDGQHTGQLKIVICGDNFANIITPATTLGAYVTATFDDTGGGLHTGSTVTLMWVNGAAGFTGWSLLSRVSGDGDTAAAVVKALPVTAT